MMQDKQLTLRTRASYKPVSGSSGTSSSNSTLPELVDPYSYKPLDFSVDSLRLLLLEPGKSDDPVKCRLIRTEFASKPRYEALSYTWGSPKHIQRILIDG
jgi:hypothetical protein